VERRRQHIDWESVRARLAHDAADDDAGGLLRARARRLAAPLEARAAGEPWVAIDRAGARYALPTAVAWRVERCGPCARLPGAPPFVLGVIPFGERPQPLVDLARLLGGGGATGPARWALLAGARAADVALACDEVALVLITPEALHPAPRDPEQVRRGVTGDARVVLDGPALLRFALARLRGASPGDPLP
jgi:chemotaxis signal transduction protein